MMPKDPSSQLPPRVGATVGLIGAAIITIGFIVDTIGEGIELSETLRRDEIEKRSIKKQQLQFKQIHQKLDRLVDEIDEMKRREEKRREEDDSL
ncbi:hypothetical protein [Psychrobacillus sp. OK032]|uniref:hypothetical protein n=1 Tax=Psychrobacillus sp. OK032 TaxID=1884358 RepID=UPI001160A3F6|nr:hypothetical protein [Psychrobacillus sp. OK032]